jgi:hypothetical protein
MLLTDGTLLMNGVWEMTGNIIAIEKVRVDGVATEPFLLAFAHQIHGPSQRSFGKSFSAFTLPNIPARQATTFYCTPM